LFIHSPSPPIFSNNCHKTNHCYEREIGVTLQRRISINDDKHTNIYDCTDDDLFFHADIKYKLLFSMLDIQTDEDQTIRKKKCQNKLDAYVQAIHRPKKREIRLGTTSEG
jgi:hypothetical protein